MKDQTIATKLKKGDLVQVISGKDKGKQGKILKINTETGRVLVEGINMVKKALKKKNQNDQGGIIDIEGAIDISNVMIVSGGKPSRIATRDKVRVAIKTGDKL